MCITVFHCARKLTLQLFQQETVIQEKGLGRAQTALKSHLFQPVNSVFYYKTTLKHVLNKLHILFPLKPSGNYTYHLI
jgi:hypothetical protein